ncbi:MAG TPA: hypothetical protein VJH87_20090 [Vicinamibacteria bacterium]|nr:hypothetical protein [Vicinamibacteria bacterium]
MVPARESRNGPTEGEEGALEPTSRKKKKKVRVAVSIRKGNLLFFPTVLPDVLDEDDEAIEPGSDRTKARESEGN